MSVKSNIVALLENGMRPHEKRIHAQLVNQIVQNFLVWPERKLETSFDQPDEDQTLLQVYEFLTREIIMQFQLLKESKILNTDFNQQLSQSKTLVERQQHILDYARKSGSSERNLRKDKKAFKRWMDADAMLDRCAQMQGEIERLLVFCMDRLCVLGPMLLSHASGHLAIERLWHSFEFDKWNKIFWSYEGDDRVRIAAFKSLSAHLRELPDQFLESNVEDSTIQFVYRSSLQTSQAVWIQCEALSLLESMSRSSLKKVLRKRLEHPGSDNDLFVRRRAVKILGDNLTRIPDLAELFIYAVDDSSPFVRQGVAKSLQKSSIDDLKIFYRKLSLEDDVAQVRASGALGCIEIIKRTEAAPVAIDILRDIFTNETDEFVLRTAIHAATEIASSITNYPEEIAASFSSMAGDCLNHLHLNATSLSVRRWASMGLGQIWCNTCSDAKVLKEKLETIISTIPPGHRRHVPRKWFKGLSNDFIGRVLSVLSQDDFGLDFKRGIFRPSITRGFIFRFRLWRMIHELRHPSPDKRQAFNHTIGRVSDSSTRAPSAIMAELSETKVPGEPLFIPTENGWRSYLPLPDDFLSCLNRLSNRPVRFYTHEGITEVRPPRFWPVRLWTYISLTLNFASLAQMRNWIETSNKDPRQYIQAMRQKGFRISFKPYDSIEDEHATTDSMVERFFTLSMPMIELQGLGERILNYFLSVYENSLLELSIFLVIITLLFLGNHWLIHLKLNKARKSIPLVVGGWGTRGKSGTERLKAALLNAGGYQVFSKTSGCEAMFMFGHTFGRLHELFIFRSYDKATIWEQKDVVHLASRLNSEVYLWECMGLTPSYVEILQKKWMRDDFSTITNTYPDHEDLQGPAGINIPQVMTRFIPKRSVLLTSEEQMKPILHDASLEYQTRFKTCGWLEAGMLTNDVLDRFPYKEHPFNVALVLSFAEELGIDQDFALKEMADYVIPDLGVLKVHPRTKINQRILEFSNGMSANERRGCIENWTRLGFNQHDPANEPGVWITAVINNRTDRIPRSRVFASMLVNDLSADRYYLIGGNLKGMMGYIREAWKQYADTITLSFQRQDRVTPPEEVLLMYAQKFRIPYTENMLRSSLRNMLDSLDNLPVEQLVDQAMNDPHVLSPDNMSVLPVSIAHNIQQYFEEEWNIYQQYKSIEQKVLSKESSDSVVLQELKKMLAGRFYSKFIVIEDYYASGEEIIHTISESTPPGYLNRIMGIQNIKGTGLDFVYRWQAWDKCHQSCQMARQEDISIKLEGLHELSSFQEFGLLSENAVRETLDHLKTSLIAQREDIQALIQVISTNLDAQLEKIQENLQEKSARKGSIFITAIFEFIESLIDGYDAIKRQRTAKKVYKDLIQKRISLQHASVVLKALNRRQKGGWLKW
jgi:gamma-polyglutamate synthase